MCCVRCENCPCCHAAPVRNECMMFTLSAGNPYWTLQRILSGACLLYLCAIVILQCINVGAYLVCVVNWGKQDSHTDSEHAVFEHAVALHCSQTDTCLCVCVCVCVLFVCAAGDAQLSGLLLAHRCSICQRGWSAGYPGGANMVPGPLVACAKQSAFPGTERWLVCSYQLGLGCLYAVGCGAASHT